MTAKGFDYYDQITAAVHPSPTPTATTATATAAPQAATTTATRSSTRALRAFVGLLIMAVAAFLAALLITVTPLGMIDADITVPFLAVFVGGIGAIVWAVLR